MLQIIESRYNLVDKSKFPDGEWMKEPDLVRLVDEDVLTPCLIRRMPEMGHLCGYVGVLEGSDLWGKHYDVLNRTNVGIEITFGGFYEDISEHIWFYGFDHAHIGDLVPMMATLFSRRKGFAGMEDAYKNIAYVISELETLVKQLKLIEQHGNRN